MDLGRMFPQLYCASFYSFLTKVVLAGIFALLVLCILSLASPPHDANYSLGPISEDTPLTSKQKAEKILKQSSLSEMAQLGKTAITGEGVADSAAIIADKKLEFDRLNPHNSGKQAEIAANAERLRLALQQTSPEEAKLIGNTVLKGENIEATKEIIRQKALEYKQGK